MRFLNPVTLLGLLLLSSPAGAVLGVPDPNRSTVDPLLVGNLGADPPGLSFAVVVRDIAGNPIAGSQVAIDFAAALGATPCATQNPGTSVNCAQRAFFGQTGVDGKVVFYPKFGGYVNSALVSVYANGVLLRRVPARSSDITRDGRCELADLAHFRLNYLSNFTAPETDYNANGATDLGDFNFFRVEFLARAARDLCP
jgi:hypothetical protein